MGPYLELLHVSLAFTSWVKGAAQTLLDFLSGKMTRGLFRMVCAAPTGEQVLFAQWDCKGETRVENKEY